MQDISMYVKEIANTNGTEFMYFDLDLDVIPTARIVAYKLQRYTGTKEMVAVLYAIYEYRVSTDSGVVTHRFKVALRNLDMMLWARFITKLEKLNTDQKGQVSANYEGHHMVIRQQTVAMCDFDVPLCTLLKTSGTQRAVLDAYEIDLNKQLADIIKEL